jgi:hypothetical protein
MDKFAQRIQQSTLTMALQCSSIIIVILTLWLYGAPLALFSMGSHDKVSGPFGMQVSVVRMGVGQKGKV